MIDHDPYTIELDTDTNTTLKLYLFKNVQNTDYIRTNIIKGLWKCAAVKPCLIMDPFQLVVAANRAVLAEKRNSMVTRSVFAEILLNLSLSKNISQSLTKFGIQKDKELLVCFLVTPDRDDSTGIIAQIDGECCPMSQLKCFTNVNDFKEAYKIDNITCEVEMVDLAVCKMVTKN